VRLSLYLFVLAIPFESIDLGFMTGMLSIAKITGALFFGICLKYRPLCFPRPARPIWWFSGYWLVTFLYTFLLPKSMLREHIPNLITVAQLILFFWVGSVLLREERILRNVAVCFLVSCSLLSIGNLLNLPGFVDMIGDEYSGYRVSALGYNLNELAALLGFALLMGVGLVLDRARWKRWKRTLLFTGLLPMLILMVRTGSRGGLLAFVVAMAWYLIPIGRKGRRIVAIAIGAAALVGVVYMVVKDPQTLQRFTKSVQEGDTAGRDIIFERARGMIKEKPIFGWGPIEYLYELGTRTGHYGGQKDPHNLYLGLLAEVGIVGILFFLRGLWLSTRAAWRARVGVFGVMPLALVTMMLLANTTGDWINRKPMWLMMTIAIGAAVGARMSGVPRQPAAVRVPPRPALS
jgi:O-antigen ligase